MSVTFRPGFRVLGSLSNMHNSPRNLLNRSPQAIQENLRFFSTKPASRVLGEIMQMKFDLHDKSYVLSSNQETRAFVQGLQAPADKASLLFKEIVACRSMISLSPDNKICHSQQIVYGKGPLNSEQILEMTRYKEEISNDDWVKHMENCSRLDAPF